MSVSRANSRLNAATAGLTLIGPTGSGSGGPPILSNVPMSAQGMREQLHAQLNNQGMGMGHYDERSTSHRGNGMFPGSREGNSGGNANQLTSSASFNSR